MNQKCSFQGEFRHYHTPSWHPHYTEIYYIDTNHRGSTSYLFDLLRKSDIFRSHMPLYDHENHKDYSEMYYLALTYNGLNLEGATNYVVTKAKKQLFSYLKSISCDYRRVEEDE